MKKLIITTALVVASLGAHAGTYLKCEGVGYAKKPVTLVASFFPEKNRLDVLDYSFTNITPIGNGEYVDDSNYGKAVANHDRGSYYASVNRVSGDMLIKLPKDSLAEYSFEGHCRPAQMMF